VTLANCCYIKLEVKNELQCSVSILGLCSIKKSGTAVDKFGRKKEIGHSLYSLEIFIKAVRRFVRQNFLLHKNFIFLGLSVSFIRNCKEVHRWVSQKVLGGR
jgi:hypothetical protein